MCVWWPMIDRDVESKVKECLVCQETAKKPPDTQKAKWSWPVGPWPLRKKNVLSDCRCVFKIFGDCPNDNHYFNMH